jgi:DNA-binding transcriptional LysR family regulator
VRASFPIDDEVTAHGRQRGPTEEDRMNVKDALTDVPIELLRTLVVTVEAGDVVEAARQLNLPRADVDADLDRLEQMLGCTLFSKAGTARRLSGRGGAILHYAKRITSMNDELMRLMSSHPPARKLQIGLPQWVQHAQLMDVARQCGAAAGGPGSVGFRCDEIETLMRDLNAGQLDLAFLCTVLEGPCVPLTRWTEPTHWIKARGAELRPGEPISLVSWPGGASDRVGTRLLEAAGIPYTIGFSGRPVAARIAAVAAGLGVMLTNERILSSDVSIAREAHLPAPPPIRTGVYARADLDLNRHAAVVRAFEASMAPRGLPMEHRFDAERARFRRA